MEVKQVFHGCSYVSLTTLKTVPVAVLLAVHDPLTTSHGKPGRTSSLGLYRGLLGLSIPAPGRVRVLA